MELSAPSARDVLRSVHESLGVPESEQLVSLELLAASLRRAASVMCPATPRALITAVEQSLGPLVSEETLRQQCREALDDLLAHGDLMEFDEVGGDLSVAAQPSRLIYTTPPCFVKVSDTRLFVLGVAPDAVDPLPSQRVPSLNGVVRSLSTDNHPQLCEQLLRAGFYELPYRAWAKAPTAKSSANMVAQFDRLLDCEPPCGSLEGLRVLDSGIMSDWYRQRWTEPRGLSGRYLATRPRKWGADLWCYVALEGGEPQRMIDLPQGRTLERGCDQAWRLQCALDAELGVPQTYQVTHITNEQVRLDIHLPCPAWLLRRWDCTGVRFGDSVFSFLFATKDMETETKLLQKQLWMTNKQ